MEDRHLDLLLEQGNNLEKTLGTSVEAQAAILQEQKKATKHLEEMSSSVRDVMENSGDEVVKGFMKLFKGEKGEKGDKGDSIKGDKGDKGEKGDTGDTGADGKDGRDGKDGKDGSPDTPGQVKNKLESLSVGNRLSYTKLDDTPDLEELYMKAVRVSSKTVSLTELDDVDLDGLQIENGKYVLASTIDLTGTADRITIGGTATHPTIDIASTYVGQTSITTLGTITTGAWQGSSIATAYTDAKVVSVNGYAGVVSLTTSDIAEGTNLYYTDARARAAITGTTNRITVTAGVVDISANYVGQTSITTLGTIATGTWTATVIGATYGGTGLNTSASTGVAQVSGGTWSISTALANGTTATTQSAADNSTKVATTAYVDSAIGTVNSLSEVLALGNTTGATDIIVTAGQTIKPSANDGAALGVSGTAWSDVFIASGGVLNFGAGEVTATEAPNTLTVAANSGNMNLVVQGAAPSMWFNIGAGASDNGSFAFKRSADNTYKWSMIGYGDSFATFPNGLTIYQSTNAAGSAVNLYRMNITDAGNVGFGTQTVAATAAKFNVLATTEQVRVQYDTSNYYSTTVGSTGAVTFDAVGSGAAFNFSDSVRINATASYSTAGVFEVNKSAADSGGAFLTWSTTDSDASRLEFSKSGSASIGTHTVVANGEGLGYLIFRGSNGSAFANAAAIYGEVDGTVTGGGASDMPGRLRFLTSPDGTATLTERMRITQAGLILVNGTAGYGREGQLFEINTSANDGGMALNTWSTSASEAPLLDFNRSKSATIGTQTSVASGDALGYLIFRGSDGTAFRNGAAIYGEVDGTPGASDMPGRLIFATSPDGSATVSERMRINSLGNIGIGTNAPQTVLHLFNGSGETFRITNTAGAGFYCETRTSASSSDIGFATLGTGKLILRAGGDTFQITSANAYFPTIGTTASAANAYLNSGSTPANELLRSTSSRVYKKDIEDMDHAYADNILKLRPVWYRSKCENDPEDFSYWGLIAEEVAEIDPRLVQWGYHNTDWDEEVVDEDGKVIKPRTLKKGAVKKPDGVTYDRLTVLLIDVVKRQEARIAQLEANIN